MADEPVVVDAPAVPVWYRFDRQHPEVEVALEVMAEGEGSPR